MHWSARILLLGLALMLCLLGGTVAFRASRIATRGEANGLGYLGLPSIDLRGHISGRVVVGAGFEIPAEALFVDVRAKGGIGDAPVRRVSPVARDGSFEVSGIPAGPANVTVELGSAEVIWELEDVIVSEAGTVDERVDPIDLRGVVFPFDLSFGDAEGEPVLGGQFLWRPSAGDSEGVRFGTPTSIQSGAARFLATGEMIDVIPLVPGSSVELFEGVRPGQEIHLGLGTTALFQATGDLPDPRTWKVHVALVPLELAPALPMAELGRAASEAEMRAELDHANEAFIPVARGGRYRLQWRVYHAHRPRQQPVVIEDTSNLEVLLAHGAGLVPIERAFPIERFARSYRGRR